MACANAGYLGAPVAYSAAPAVSTSYISQASPLAYAAHAAPVAYAAHAAPVAYAAHAPAVAYAHAPVAVHAPAIGASQQSVYRSLGGNQAVSTYSKAVDSAFSSVRKFDTRVTNDALYASPVVSTYAAHAPVVSTYAAHAPVVSTYAAHAPVVSAYAAHAPLAVAHSGPLVATKSAAIAYSPAAVVSHASFNGLGVSYGW